MSIFLSHCDPQIKLAAPSWVIPGTVAENCCYLSGRVDEIALLFFETESCLNYSEKDLPHELSNCGLSFHIHHPLDLPWHKGGAEVARIVCALISKTEHLNPQTNVIHPPPFGPEAAGLITDFKQALAGAKYPPHNFLFENIKENSLSGLVDHIRSCGFKICLDLGHILAYGQQSLFDEDLKGMVGMLHLNAPGRGGRHESLAGLDGEGLLLLGRMLENLEKNGTVTVEVFEEKGFFESLAFLNEYCSCE